jgi:hypothetical protein
MDASKCKALKAELARQPPPHVVAVERFFDGNDDLGSIGCNLAKHPGVDQFRDTLVGLLHRSDVEAVDAQISELDPGERRWPFTDTILVAGRISVDDLRAAVNALEPDEVGPAENLGVSSAVTERYASPVLVVWWD